AFKMKRNLFNDSTVVGSTPHTSSTPSSISPTIQDEGIGGTQQNLTPTSTQQTVPVPNVENEAPTQTETAAESATTEPSKEVKRKPTRAPSSV
ncbi:hypothetical protein PIB30_113270, partial [Stylosanthes scabra]|nr:hypothetical protein [Stylosanthes scabra]